jgi:hypothetical protein
MPYDTSGCLIKEVLQNAAHAEATDPTIVLRTRSLVPLAFFVIFEVIFLKDIATIKDAATAPE